LGEVTSVREAIGALVRDGDAVALEGFTHLNPTAAAHEIIRQKRRKLTLTAVHPGATVEQAKEATGWDLRTAGDLYVTDPPTREELQVLRDLHARTEAARKGAAP
jgi:glutaconate CoA-transferase, subunit B